MESRLVSKAAMDMSGKPYSLEVICSGLVERWVDPRKVLYALQILHHVVDCDSDGGDIGIVLVWDLGNDHVEISADGGASASDLTSSEVERQCHRVAVGNATRAFNTRCPLHVSVDAIGTHDLFPHCRAKIRCGLGKWSRALGQVCDLVLFNRSIPCGWPVVVRNVGMGNDSIGVKMIVEIVANGKVDPGGFVDHGWPIGTGFDNLKLVGWSDSTSEQKLWRSKSTGCYNYTAGDWCEIDRTRVSAVVGCDDLQSCCMASFANDSLDAGIQPKLEVGAGCCSNEVCGHWPTPFSANNLVRWVSVCPILVSWVVVCSDASPSRIL